MNINDVAKDLIMIAIVGAVIVFAGFEILHDPQSDAAKSLLGAVLPAFGVIIARLFGTSNP